MIRDDSKSNSTRQDTIKLCMVVHAYYYGDTRVRRYVDALVDKGVWVDVLCLRDQSEPRRYQSGVERVFTIPIGRFANSLGGYVLEYGIAFILFSIRLLGLHIRNHYDVIHVHNMPDFLIFAALIPKILGAKLILDIHDPMPEFYMSKFELQESSALVWLMEIQERLSSLFSHAVITANTHFKNNITGRGVPAEKITVVNNYPDPEVFDRNQYREKYHSDKKYFTLFYPGTVAPRYGLDVAIRALPKLVGEIPQLRLVIVARQRKFVDELTALANQLGVSDFIQFKPSVPVEEIAKEIARADIGIYPGLPDPHMSIAMPTKVLEYAFMGIPIVASRLRVLSKFFGDSAVMFFEPGNVDQFSECVLELFYDPDRRQELIQNAKERLVCMGNWDEERDAYFSLLNRLVAAI
jgi:glycosyltransferase involved in cell wall biosynthesis